MPPAANAGSLRRVEAAAQPAELETRDMLVLTVAVPTEHVGELAVSVIERTVVVTGPGGFIKQLQFPLEADMGRLHAGLYRGILELRAPRETAPPARSIEIQAL